MLMQWHNLFFAQKLALHSGRYFWARKIFTEHLIFPWFPQKLQIGPQSRCAKLYLKTSSKSQPPPTNPWEQADGGGAWWAQSPSTSRSLYSVSAWWTALTSRPTLVGWLWRQNWRRSMEVSPWRRRWKVTLTFVWNCNDNCFVEQSFL